MAKKKQTFESLTGRLEEIVRALENPGTPLEQALDFYKEGIEAAAKCLDMLDSTRAEVLLVSKTIDGRFIENDFE